LWLFGHGAKKLANQRNSACDYVGWMSNTLLIVLLAGGEPSHFSPARIQIGEAGDENFYDHRRAYRAGLHPPSLYVGRKRGPLSSP